MEVKCDFCDKPFKWYGSHQCVLYCDDHIKEAEEIENQMWKEFEKVQQERND